MLKGSIPHVVRSLVISSVAMLAGPVWAWNDVGHMIVASIAYGELTPEARQRVNEMLHQHPRYEKDLLRDMPEGFADPDLYAFMRAAVWPDMVRDLGHPMHGTHHHSNWHYVDFPLVSPADQQTLHPPQPDLTGERIDNAIKALTKANADLQKPDAASAEKAIALCWLLHLTGDLHQPLHATSFFSQAYPKGDRGGNAFLVRSSSGEVINLHALWDGMLGPVSSPRAIRLLTENMLAHPTLTRKSLADWLAHTTIKSWADESYADSRDIVYLGFHLRGATPEQSVTVDTSDIIIPPAASLLKPATKPAAPALPAPISPTPTAGFDRRGSLPGTAPALPTSYEDVARQVARQRVVLAGYRLADQLNQQFGEKKQ